MSQYQRWYDDIVERAQTRNLDCYHEVHHILPRCLGGDDGSSNLVALTYREHFLVHWLLIKIYDGEARRPLLYALHCMTLSLAGRIVAGWQFDVAKRAVKAEALKRAEARRVLRKIERREALKRFEETESVTSKLSHVKDRHQLGEIADHWLKWQASIRNSQKRDGIQMARVPALVPNRDELLRRSRKRRR